MGTEARQSFDVSGMTCGHCVQAVTDAIHALDSQAQVEIDLASGKVTVRSAADRAELVEAIAGEGYEVAG